MVWDSTRSGILDSEGVYVGLDGVGEFWRSWLEAWERIDFELVELRRGRQRRRHSLQSGRTSRSGAGVTTHFEHTLAFTFRGPKIVRVDQFPTREDALAALAF